MVNHADKGCTFTSSGLVAWEMEWLMHCPCDQVDDY